MSKKVEAAKGKEMEPSDLIQYARQTFGTMQRSWWEFAKAIYKIREEQTYSKDVLGSEDGFDSFKEFCFHEYPTIDLSTIYKFCTIVEDWQETMDAKIKKDPTFELPAYEACYRLIAAKNSLAKEEVSRLKKALMEHKISYRGLQEQLKDMISRKEKETAKLVDESEETVRKIEDNLTKDLEDEDLEDFTSDELLDDPEADFESEDSDEDIMDDEDETDSSVVSCTLRAKYLIDNLPAVEILMKKGGKKTKELSDLASALEDLSDVANNFFTKFEKLK